MATAWSAKFNSAALNAAFISSIPFLVSLVPPDLEITITSVFPNELANLDLIRSIPSGSVLSINQGVTLSLPGCESA